MRRSSILSCLLIGGLAASTLPRIAWSQVKVSLNSAHYQFLQYEAIPVTVTIQNNTDVPLIFGPDKGAARLEFDVEMGEDDLIPKAGGAAPEAEWTLPPWKSETREINLVKQFNIRRQGPYRIVARVAFAGLEFRSNRFLLDVLPGLEVAHATAISEQGTRRMISLRSLSRDRHNRAFLQIIDEKDGVVYATQDMGPIIRSFEPQIRLSSDSTVHVLFQSAPLRLTHGVTALDGKPVSVTYHGISPTVNATLSDDRQGRIRLEGVEPYIGDPMEESVRVPDVPPKRL